MKSIMSVPILACAALLTHATVVPAADSEKGFTPIFNGKDLAGWNGDAQLWSVKEGVITGQTTEQHPAKGNTFLIWTNGTVADFEFRCSFKIAPNNDKGFANSGIQYRSKVLDEKNWVVGGYQADMEAGPTYTGILYDEQGVAGGRNIMAARGEKVVWDKDCQKQVAGSLGKSEELQAALKQGDWNDYTVIAQGNHFQHFINGKQTVDVIDDCEAKRLTSGVLALQLHAGQPMTVQFRNIRIKTLSGEAGPAAAEMEKLQGVWEVASGEVNGGPMPAEDTAGITLTIAGNKYTAVKADFNDHGSFSIDATRNPKQMDVRPETGSGAGKTILAIYEAGSAGLRVCYATQDTGRPTAFTTEVDSGRVVFTYKRKK